MFLHIITAFASNIRLLGVHTNTGYFFGSIDNNISLAKDIRNAHQYTYKRISQEPYFYIEVTTMPNVYWAYDEAENTIKYQFTKMPNDKNVFKIIKKPGYTYYHIMHGEKCLLYSELFDKIILDICNEIDGYQSFVAYCHVQGELIEDFLPSYELPISKLLIIE